MIKAETITFFIPKKLWPTPFPDENDFAWDGYKDGIYCWTLQTYFRLKQSGFDCEISSEFPDKGIIAAHRGCLDDSIRPTKDQLLVCFQADWGRHPYAQVHVVQNPLQTQLRYTPIVERFFMPGKRFFMRLWSQPGLIPRDGSRGNIFKRIAYFGRPDNLASELQTEEWDAFIKEQGCEWVVVSDPSACRNYSKFDATISIRSFDQNHAYHKPATKLYNSWVARVIPICFPESAYAAEKKDEHDCVMVETYDQLKSAILLLCGDVDKRQKYLDGSRLRSDEVSVSFQVNEWRGLIYNDFRQEFIEWQNKPWWNRKVFFIVRGIGYTLKKMLSR